MRRDRLLLPAPPPAPPRAKKRRAPHRDVPLYGVVKDGRPVVRATYPRDAVDAKGRRVLDVAWPTSPGILLAPSCKLVLGESDEEPMGWGSEDSARYCAEHIGAQWGRIVGGRVTDLRSPPKVDAREDESAPAAALSSGGKPDDRHPSDL